MNNYFVLISLMKLMCAKFQLMLIHTHYNTLIPIGTYSIYYIGQWYLLWLTVITIVTLTIDFKYFLQLLFQVLYPFFKHTLLMFR